MSSACARELLHGGRDFDALLAGVALAHPEEADAGNHNLGCSDLELDGLAVQVVEAAPGRKPINGVGIRQSADFTLPAANRQAKGVSK